MPVKIGSRYTKDHIVVRTPTTYEELNSPCESHAEHNIQTMLLTTVRPPRQSFLPARLAALMHGVFIR